MAAWWHSLETIVRLNSWARWGGWILGAIGVLSALFGALFGLVALVSGMRIETLKAERDADRTLTTEQADKMLRVLRDAPAGTVEIGYPINDLEGKQFAERIASVLRDGGWTVSRVSAGGYAGMNPTGLIIASPDSANPSDLALRRAFEAAGLRLGEEPDTHDPNIVLIVGKKPKISN